MHRSEHSCYAVAKNIPPFPRTGQLCIGNDFQRTSEAEVFRYRDFRAESPAARIIPHRSHVSPSDLSDMIFASCDFDARARASIGSLAWGHSNYRGIYNFTQSLPTRRRLAFTRNRVNKRPPASSCSICRRAVLTRLAIAWRYLETCPIRRSTRMMRLLRVFSRVRAIRPPTINEF